jgi:hypothetical protein
VSLPAPVWLWHEPQVFGPGGATSLKPATALIVNCRLLKICGSAQAAWSDGEFFASDGRLLYCKRLVEAIGP